MKIDAHQHFWKYDPIKYSWIDSTMQVIQKDFLPDDLFPELEKKGIEGCIAVQADESKEETRFLLELAHKNSWIRKTVGWLDFGSDHMEEELEEYSHEKKLAGFRKALQAYPPEAMEEKAFLKGIGNLGKYRFTYDILIYPQHLEAAYLFAKKFPNQSFVVDHLAKPNIKNGEFEFWSNNMLKLASLPHVRCKVSGMVTEADWKNWKSTDFIPYLDLVTEHFGINRLLYGSDWPVCLVAADYGKVYDLVWDYYGKFSISEQENIFGGNAAKFYGL